MGPLQKHVLIDPVLHLVGGLCVIAWWELVIFMHPHLWGFVIFVLSMFASFVIILVIALVHQGLISGFKAAFEINWTVVPVAVIVVLALLSSAGLYEEITRAAEEGREPDTELAHVILFWGHITALLISWLVATLRHFRR